MEYPFYLGQGRQSDAASKLYAQSSRVATLADPASYRADPGLAAAATVALVLGQPLLLTGEPGVGKTEFAYSLAWELGLDRPLKFETKSTTTARDLFYSYDSLKRFHDAHAGGQETAGGQEILKYITFNALGRAILRSCELGLVARLSNDESLLGERVRSVVLIDEIDKAPRDFSNDLLNELEHMYFRIPELGNEPVKADAQLRPIVVITSNSERDLPDAFLRRCVYYNIPFPDRKRLIEIVEERLRDRLSDRAGIDWAVKLFLRLRDPASGLRKKPATAELLGWLSALNTFSEGRLPPPAEKREAVLTNSLSSLFKTADDQERASEIVKQWLAQAN